jgi:ATP-dependent RNA helicase RhlE
MQQGFIRLDAVEILILDEADRMLDMGFIHDLRKIVAHVPSERQTLMFSATMPEPIKQLATEWLHKPVHIQVASTAATPDKVQQSVYFVERGQKPHLLSRFLQRAVHERALVFTRTRRGADKVARSLRGAGIRALSIHGEKSQGARKSAIREFSSPKPPVLVATDIAARGLDISGISHVVNYDLPEEPETYIHRIGRTARAGADGCAISFCGCDERPRLKRIERLMGRSVAVEKTLRPTANSGSMPAKTRSSELPANHPVGESRPANDATRAAGKPPKKRKRQRPSSGRPKNKRRVVARAN